MTTNEPPPPGQPTPPSNDLPSYGSVPPPPGGSYPPPPPGGQPPAPGGYGGAPQQNKKAMWSMISGIVSILICGVILGPVAIVLSSQAKSEIAASGGAQTGGGQAKAGLILGIIGVVGWVIYLIVAFAL